MVRLSVSQESPPTGNIAALAAPWGGTFRKSKPKQTNVSPLGIALCLEILAKRNLVTVVLRNRGDTWMRDHPDGPTGESAIACLRLVREPVRGTGSDGSVSNQRPPPKKQRWGKSKTVLSETAGSRVPVKQHSERCLQREERNSDEDAELWRCGIAAAGLLSIVAMLSLAVFSIITKSVPTYIEWLPLSGWPVP